MATSTPADTTYALSDDHVAFRDTIRQIVRERVAPRAAEIDAKAEYPWDLRKLFAEQDLLGLPFEEEYGGTGTGTLMLNIAIEEVAKACASTALILMVQELGTLPIRLFGSRRAQAALPAALRERRVVARVRAVRARGGLRPRRHDHHRAPRRRRVGDQRHQELDHEPRHRRLLRRVRGHGPARRGASPPSSSRPTAPASASASSSTSSASRARRPASRSSTTSACRPRTSSAPRARACRVALGTLDHSRLGVAAQAVGIAQGATDYAAAYARERKQFGQPINEFQAIQFKLADMETRTAAARELLYKACAKIDRHEPDRGKYSAMAKLFASDTAMAVTIEAVQVLGGYGYVTEYPVERFMRDAKITQIYEGTNEIQRLVIARTMK